jgi:WNK lysine deficient protein kinase
MTTRDSYHARSSPIHAKDRPADVTDPDDRYKRSDEYIAIGPSLVRYKGYDKNTGLEVTWHEVLLPNRVSPEGLQSICAGADRFKALRHESLGVLHSYWVSPDQSRVTFITESICAKNVLDDFLRDDSAIRPKVVVKWFRPVLEVLRYLHSLSPPITHHKIDLSSIFVRSASGAVKVGMPLLVPFEFSMGRSIFKLTATTPPEHLLGMWSTASDIWSFGLAMLIVLTKQVPYDECTTPFQLVQKLSAYEKPNSFSLLTDRVAIDLIGACLQPPEKRWTADNLLNHPFFTRAGGDGEEKKSAGPGMVVLFTQSGKPS